jgi:hypothetical protein
MENLDQMFKDAAIKLGINLSAFSYEDVDKSISMKDKILNKINDEIKVLMKRDDLVKKQKSEGSKLKEDRMWKVVGDKCYVNIKFRGAMFPKGTKQGLKVDNNVNAVMDGLKLYYEVYNNIGEDNIIFQESKPAKKK